jgi:phosphoadenosine phosphosulfate reductase
MAALGDISKSSLITQLGTTQNKFKYGQAMAAEHIAKSSGFVAFSGGKDSLVSLHLALQADPHIPVCFYDSGLEFPENIEYIHSIANLYSINLHIIKSDPSILDILRKEATFDHKRTPVHLKASLVEAKIIEPSRKAHERFGPGRIWGLRGEESRERRMLLLGNKGSFESKAGEHITSPVWNWTTDQIFGYIEAHNIPLNPVYTKLRSLGVEEKGLRVGSIIDGSNLDYGRVTWLKRGWPEIYDQLRIVLPRLDEFR